MAGERRRRLAAILAADVAGYSRLLGADEDGTLAGLRAPSDKAVRLGVAARCRQVSEPFGDAFQGVDFPPWSGGVRSKRHAAARMAIPTKLARASAGVR